MSERRPSDAVREWRAAIVEAARRHRADSARVLDVVSNRGQRVAVVAAGPRAQ